MGGDGNNSTSGGSTLAATYPVNTLMELKLAPTGTTIRGLIYTTDEISNSIVLKKSLVHTTLSSEITVINAGSVMESKALDVSKKDIGEESARELAGVSNLDELKVPLPSVSRKALEEREKRAIRLAEESFSHINQKASPEGQKIFDKLLKACNEVVWKGESILVLKEIRVDPPYTADNCSLIINNGANSGGLDEHSLERVKKIVKSAATTQS
eukprot:CAMPEP_0172309312 /NCGR_PEP_ID=MMETSP1058-20130122/9641_1 /TAXON_ID=83371 /ORGANISM="Detonula confervacea, Strain CCMP 353" /LENGTH=212 /DNA_ID=CAMNT_0013021909 /DNA_START=145 /DNA_END=783 /DNA_ORIENTATION=-